MGLSSSETLGTHEIETKHTGFRLSYRGQILVIRIIYTVLGTLSGAPKDTLEIGFKQLRTLLLFPNCLNV